VLLFNSSAIFLKLLNLGFVDQLGFFKRSFGFRDRLLLQLPPLLPRSLFLPTRGVAPLLFSLKGECRIFGSLLIDLLSLGLSFETSLAFQRPYRSAVARDFR
jgi:hypothetical protein